MSTVIAAIAGVVFAISLVLVGFGLLAIMAKPRPMPLWEMRQKHVRRTAPIFEVGLALMALSGALIFIAAFFAAIERMIFG